MSDEEVYKKARARVQSKISGRCVTDNEIIVELEREIEYYRSRIREFMNKDTEKSNSINIKLHLETDEAMQKLEEVSKLLEKINNKPLVALGIDNGQAKDYITVAYYKDEGNLVKEETTQYK